MRGARGRWCGRAWAWVASVGVGAAASHVGGTGSLSDAIGADSEHFVEGTPQFCMESRSDTRTAGVDRAANGDLCRALIMGHIPGMEHNCR